MDAFAKPLDDTVVVHVAQDARAVACRCDGSLEPNLVAKSPNRAGRIVKAGRFAFIKNACGQAARVKG